MTADRKERLKAILKRPHNANETLEHTQARLRHIIEGTDHCCPTCGFLRFVGTIHPFAGISGKTKEETRWCTGKEMIERKSQPKEFQSRCPKCGASLMMTHAELSQVAAQGMCHECLAKEEDDVS